MSAQRANLGWLGLFKNKTEIKVDDPQTITLHTIGQARPLVDELTRKLKAGHYEAFCQEETSKYLNDQGSLVIKGHFLFHPRERSASNIDYAVYEVYDMTGYPGNGQQIERIAIHLEDGNIYQGRFNSDVHSPHFRSLNEWMAIRYREEIQETDKQLRRWIRKHSPEDIIKTQRLLSECPIRF